MTKPERLAYADARLLTCQARIDQITGHKRRPRYAVGVPILDQELATLGRELLAQGRMAGDLPAPGKFDGHDIYLATHLPSVGGHTRLLGDMVAALCEDGAKPAPHLYLTDLYQHPEGAIPDLVRDDLGLRSENIHILAGNSLGAKFEGLLEALAALRPRHLFLFHHPGDPLPVAAAGAGVAGKVFLVHHADSMPSLGLHLPGVRVVELHPFGAAQSRVLGIPNVMLPLTSPDPGPRPHGFLQDGCVVTATSGREDKFTLDFHPTYPEAVVTILKTAQGRHVHFGPLTAQVLAAIKQALEAHQLPAASFLHVPWVPSLCRALWEHKCDVYLHSFPVNGARAGVEVAASGTPVIKFVRQFRPSMLEDTYQPAGALYWTTLEDLEQAVSQCRSAEFLDATSQLIRAQYMGMNHPRVFRETLHSIINGGPGATDPLSDRREIHRLAAMLRDLPHPGSSEDEVGELRQKLMLTTSEHAQNIQALDQWAHQLQARCTKLEVKLSKLQEKYAKLQETLKPIRDEHKQLARGRGWQARLRRWLLGMD